MTVRDSDVRLRGRADVANADRLPRGGHSEASLLHREESICLLAL